MFLGILSGLCAGALWGLVFLAPKALHNHTSADIAFGRYVVFGTLSFMLLLHKADYVRQLLKPSVILNAALLSCLSFSLYYLALAASIKFSGVALATFIIALLPITIPLVCRDKVANKGSFTISLVMIVGGLLLLNSPLFLGHTESTLPLGSMAWGLVLAITACALWTAYAPLNTKFLLKNPEIDSGIWTSLLGVFALITMLPIWLWTNSGNLLQASQLLFSWQYLVWMIIIGAGSSWLATYFWNYACRRIPTPLAGQLIVSEAVFSLIYNYIDEWTLPHTYEVIAAAILVGGVLAGIHAFQHGKPDQITRV